MKHGLRLAAAISVLLLAAVACGGDDDGGSAGAAGGSDGPTLEITEPAEGATISVPFTISVNSSEELGSSDTGLHHVHVFFDGNDSTYEIVESNTWEIGPDSPAVEGLTPGEHVLHASLRNADHSAAGAEAEITVTVGDAGATPSGDQSDTAPPPVYDY